MTQISVQIDVRVSQLVLRIQGIPDVANCAILWTTALRVSPMNASNVLGGHVASLDAQIKAVLHLFQPFAGLI